MTTKIINTKYPIVEAGMNPASDLNLALAVAKAGGFPTIAVWAYLIESEDDVGAPVFKPNFEKFKAALDQFYQEIGNKDIMITIFWKHLFNEEIMQLLETFQPKLVELVFFKKPHLILPLIRNAIQRMPNLGIDETTPLEVASKTIIENSKRRLRAAGSKILFRCARRVTYEEAARLQYDGLTIKGSESGGHNDVNSVWENFTAQKALTPNLICIPYGGVGKPEHVKKYMDAGADGVGIGTLLAASLESPLSTETKQKMIDASSDNITKIGRNNQQNALVFKPLSDDLVDDFNSNRSLRLGMATGQEGHIYAGTSVDYVKSIRPVKEIIEELSSLL